MTSSGRPRAGGDRLHPWPPAAVLWLTAAMGLSLIMIVGGYAVTSGTVQTRAQLTGVNLGLAAVVLQAASCIAWTTRGQRGARLRQRELMAQIDAFLCRREQPSEHEVRYPPGRGVQAARELRDGRIASAPVAGELVVVLKGTTFHDTTCALVRGKSVVARGAQATQGRQACRVCQL